MNNRELAAEAVRRMLSAENSTHVSREVIETLLNEQQPSNREKLPPAPWRFDTDSCLILDASGRGIASSTKHAVGRALAKFPNAITALRQAAVDLDAHASGLSAGRSVCPDAMRELAATYHKMADAFERGEDLRTETSSPGGTP
ncbi:MAG: hypothetical protein V3W41_14615 [Planctomycetota bacterium]